FATEETCPAGWWLVRRAPLPATFNRTYAGQEAALESDDPARPRRRSAPEIAFDTLLWHHLHGERLLSDAWDWSRSVSTDQGYAALGEYGVAGLRVTAYSRAVRFGTLGVCPQRGAGAVRATYGRERRRAVVPRRRTSAASVVGGPSPPDAGETGLSAGGRRHAGTREGGRRGPLRGAG